MILFCKGVMMYVINNKQYQCSVAVTLDIFNDRWKMAIIWYLLEKDKRFKDLSKDISEITQKTLTIKLKELEEKNIIFREAFPEVPPRVVYSLTPIGKSLRPVLEAMHQWGREYVSLHGSINDELNSCESILFTDKKKNKI